MNRHSLELRAAYVAARDDKDLRDALGWEFFMARIGEKVGKYIDDDGHLRISSVEGRELFDSCKQELLQARSENPDGK